MQSLKVSSTGKITEKDLSRKELTDTFGIHSRDLRPIFTKKETTSILPRGNCIVVSVRSIKMVVGTKYSFIFNIDKKKIPDYFIPLLLERLEKTKNDKTLFEHTVLETALHYALLEEVVGGREQ